MILTEILLASLVIVGANIAIKELIDSFWTDPFELYQSLPKWAKHLSKPTWYCPTCMASVWGTMIHFYLGGSLVDWPLVVLSLAFVNTYFAQRIK
jgi:thymidine kinase